jgi:hypothetical protein
MVVYEELLDRDLDWALQEGSRHFDETNSVHKTLRKIVRRLDELNVPYALAGGMALFFHGFRRFTEDVDILVTRAGLKVIHEHLEGLGYVPPFAGGENLRDAEFGVRVEFLVTGDYPGDGKPKPIAFPDPKDVAVDKEGIRCLDLARLIELKLASGMTNPRRLKDLVDVQALIEALGLPESFASQLHPFVQDKYKEIWKVIDTNPA